MAGGCGTDQPWLNIIYYFLLGQAVSESTQIHHYAKWPSGH